MAFAAYQATVLPGQVDNWRFGTGSTFADNRAALLALADDDTILIYQSASRFQTITVSGTPTLSGTVVLVTGIADRGSSLELPRGFGGSTITLTPAPSGGGDGVDQTARDSAASAQTTADGAQTEIDAHEATTHNTDSTARTAAATAQSEIEAHEASTHNTDITAQSTALNARQTAEQAQTTIETHERATHNTDTTARNAAAAAQTTANTARTELTAHEGTPHGGGGTTDQTARDAATAAPIRD